MANKKDLGKVGLCLAGGGAKGILSSGMVKAFHDLGMEYDVLAGISVGALIGSVLHQGDFDRVIPLWMNIKSSDVFKWSPWEFYKPFTNKSCLYDSNPLEKLLKKNVNPIKLRSNPKPFYVGTTDLKMKRNMVLPISDLEDPEEIIQFLKASASPPIFFPPVNFRGSTLGDGGVADNYNIDVLRDEDCDTIIVFYPTHNVIDPVIDNIKEMLEVVISTPNNSLLFKETKAISKVNKIIDQFDDQDPTLKKINLIVVSPNKPIDVGLLDFDYKDTKYKREDLVKIGYESAYEALRDLC